MNVFSSRTSRLLLVSVLGVCFCAGAIYTVHVSFFRSQEIEEEVYLEKIEQHIRDKKAFSGSYIPVLADQYLSQTVQICDAPDITVGSITIMACNIGTHRAGTGSQSYGSYFQWGSMYGWESDHREEIGVGYRYSNGRRESQGDIQKIWKYEGDIEKAGEDRWFGTPGSLQGPCPAGYHVPTISEWQGLIAAGRWGTQGEKIHDALLLPFAGNRHNTTGVIQNQGVHGLYWTTTPQEEGAYRLHVYKRNIYSDHYFDRSVGFSVRCFRDK